MLLVAVAACGRVGFDPINGNPLGGGDATTSPGSDSGIGGSDARRSGPGADAQPLACANALPVQVNVLKTTSTCVGGDHIDGCGPVGTQEVVFEFVAPAAGSYMFEAYDTGTTNVSNSTATLDPMCTTLQSGCDGILGLALNQGDVLYLIVEASSGGCATIDFSVTSS